jgi:hypothetical protein
MMVLHRYFSPNQHFPRLSILLLLAAGTTVLSDSATLAVAGDTTDVASSVMGTVVMNKLTSAYFQPDLVLFYYRSRIDL